MIKKLFYLILGLLFCGCGALFQTMPPPQAGLTVFVNPNMGAVAQCWLYTGYWSEDRIIAVDQNGRPKFATQSMMQFEVSSSFSEEIKEAPWTILPAPASYTLFIVWARFNGQILGMSVEHFDTSNDPFRSPYTDMFGRKIYVDTIVELSSVETSIVTQISINKTIYAADWLKGLIGLP